MDAKGIAADKVFAVLNDWQERKEEQTQDLYIMAIINIINYCLTKKIYLIRRNIQ